MSGQEFTAWMEAMGLSISGAMAALGYSTRHTIIKFKREGAPRVVALACAAIEAGLAPWGLSA